MASIRYLENRVWFLGAKVLLQNSRNFNDHINLGKFHEVSKAQSEDILSLPATAWVTAKPASLWTMDEYLDALVLRFDNKTNRTIRQYVDVEKDWPMRSFRLAIHASGFLHMLSEFEIVQLDKEANLETATDIIQESLSRLYPFIAYVVEQIHNAGYILKSSSLHFGVPTGETSENQYDVFGTYCNPFDAFSYNQHFILDTDDEKEANALAEQTGIGSECTKIGGIKLRIGHSVRIWSGRSAEIHRGLEAILKVEPIDWELSLSENGLVRGFWVETLQLSKLVVSSTAQTVYVKLLLRAARQEESLEPEKLRTIIDLNNGILQQLNLYDWRLDEEQIEILKCLQDKTQEQSAIDTYRSSEENLVASVEGLESLSSRKLSRSTESILFVLTILSVYSIASDVATFLGSRDDLLFPSPPIRIGIIIAATAIIALVLVLVRQRHSSVVTKRKDRKLRS